MKTYQIVVILFVIALCLPISGCDNPSYTKDEILSIAKTQYHYVENMPWERIIGDPYNWRAEYAGEGKWYIRAEAKGDPEYYNPSIARHLQNPSAEVSLGWIYYEKTDVLIYSSELELIPEKTSE